MLVHGKEQLTALGCRRQFQKFNKFAPSWEVSRGLPDTKKRKVPYFSDYKTPFPTPQIWEENGGASYIPNIAYLAPTGFLL